MVEEISKVISLRMGLIVSQIMSIVFLLANLSIFIHQESVMAKSMTVVSFNIFLFLLIVSFMATLNLKKEKTIKN